MELIKKNIRNMNHLLEKFDWVAPLVARLSIGWVFLWAGIGKFGDLAQVTEYFQSLGIPMASVQAPFIALLELTGGVFLILGFGTRLFSFLLANTMVVALLTAHSEDIGVFSDIFKIFEFGYILVFLFLITRGSGWLSIDGFLKKKC